MKKRSITIDGHRTSLSLETAFWQALYEIAAKKKCSVPKLIRDIDEARMQGPAAEEQQHNLSSAVRVMVLHFYQAELAKAHSP